MTSCEADVTDGAVRWLACALSGSGRTKFFQRPGDPQGLFVDPFPPFDVMCFDEDCFQVIYYHDHSTKLLLLMNKGLNRLESKNGYSSLIS
jgi:hypothetical protein